MFVSPAGMPSRKTHHREEGLDCEFFPRGHADWLLETCFCWGDLFPLALVTNYPKHSSFKEYRVTISELVSRASGRPVSLRSEPPEAEIHVPARQCSFLEALLENLFCAHSGCWQT